MTLKFFLNKVKESIIKLIMKEITKEKKSTYTVYQAVDGTEFNSKEECQKYEDTAKCLLLTKYKPLVKRTVNEYGIFNTGSDEYMIDILQYLSSESDIDILIQLHRLYCSRKLNDEYYVDMRNKLEKCLKNRDIVLIGRGTEYDGYDNFFILTTLQEVTDNITKAE